MGYVTKNNKPVEKAGISELKRALDLNSKQQLALRQAIIELKAEGNLAAAREGQKEWLGLKHHHTILEKLLRSAMRGMQRN
tara:strand:+ start:96 stop:338 length:243 start_codon:yes stop_codon:yes gene_type:complete